MKQDILKAKKQARKDKNKKLLGFLDLVVQSAETIAKSDKNRASIDEDFITALGKVKKMAQSSIIEFDKVNVPKDNSEYMKAEDEINFSNGFLPKEMTDADLLKNVQIIVKTLNKDVLSMKGMGVIMAAFRTQYAGQFDPKKLSTVVKGQILGN